MARINLLPWRAERRKLRQKEFMTMVGFAAIAAVAIAFLISTTPPRWSLCSRSPRSPRLRRRC